MPILYTNCRILNPNQKILSGVRPTPQVELLIVIAGKHCAGHPAMLLDPRRINGPIRRGFAGPHAVVKLSIHWAKKTAYGLAEEGNLRFAQVSGQNRKFWRHCESGSNCIS